MPNLGSYQRARDRRCLRTAILFFSSFYGVAATTAEPGIINWALANIQNGLDQPARNRRSTNLAGQCLRGAGRRWRIWRTRGCLNCHGGPGVKSAKFTEGMLPYPPDLKDIAKEKADRHNCSG